MSITPFRDEWIGLCKHYELKSSECWTPLKVRNLVLSLVDIKIRMRERGGGKNEVLTLWQCYQYHHPHIKVEKALCKDEQVALGMHRALKWTNQYELGTGILLMSCSLAEVVCFFVRRDIKGMSMDGDVSVAEASSLFLPLLCWYKCTVTKGIPVGRGKIPPPPHTAQPKTDDIWWHAKVENTQEILPNG